MMKLISLGFGLVLFASCLAPGKDDYSVPSSEQEVPFDIGAQAFPFGDRVVITEVISSHGDYSAGSVLLVRGTYELLSRDEAHLYFGVTTDASLGIAAENGPESSLLLKRGKGDFELANTMPGPGSPHVTFYDGTTGKPFAGAYFGIGETLCTGSLERYGN